MRFDLELKMVSQLTKSGLDNLAETLYGDSSIVPMFWDQSSATDKMKLNKGSVNYTNYNKKENIEDSYISSGVDTSKDDLKFVNNILFGSTVIPVFNNGNYTVNKSRYILSKNNIVKPFEFDGKRYKCEVGESVSPSKVIVSTTSLVYPGYNKTKRDFINVQWDQMYYESLLSEMTAEEALEKTLDFVFKSNTSDYKFCMIDGTIYLSCSKISYTNKAIGIAENTTNKIFVLPEFPATNLSISGYPASGYTHKSGIIIFKHTTNVAPGTIIYASYDVTPYVSYIDPDRSTDADYVFFNTNMHPKLVNYKNGTLCLSNSFGDTDIPVSLNMKANKVSVFGAEPFKVTSKLTGIGEIPVPNKKVKLEIVTDNAVFVDTNSNIAEKTTLADGTVDGEVVARTDRIGYYIQKEWVVDNKIRIPFKINDININAVYTYFITSDDPILGKKYRSIYDSSFSESYTNTDISTYQMNGRKVAYVSLQDNNETLVSRFIKPVSFEYKTNQVMTYRNLYYGLSSQSASGIFSNAVSGTFSSTISVNGEYDTGVLPNNRMDLYSYNAEDVTEIVFEKNIPTGGSIAGFWLITDGSIKIKASYDDDNIILNSQVVNVGLQNIKSENSFIINKYNTSQGASQLGAFGYLTISEYLKNPFGLNAFSMYCTHSDCVYKKCIHPDPSIQKNFILDEGKVGCIHNREWDAENWVCPGQDAHLVNPFIMHLEGI